MTMRDITFETQVKFIREKTDELHKVNSVLIDACIGLNMFFGECEIRKNLVNASMILLNQINSLEAEWEIH